MSIKDSIKNNLKARKPNEQEVLQTREDLIRDLFSTHDGKLPLMHQLARTVWSFKLAYEKNMGFSGPQVWILLMLAKKEAHVGLTQSELTHIMKVDASAITRMVKAMEEKALIRRESDLEDNRLTRVYLTPKGHEAAKGLSERAQAVEQRITAQLTPAQLDQLRQVLTILQITAQDEYEKAGREQL